MMPESFYNHRCLESLQKQDDPSRESTPCTISRQHSSHPSEVSAPAIAQDLLEHRDKPLALSHPWSMATLSLDVRRWTAIATQSSRRHRPKLHPIKVFRLNSLIEKLIHFHKYSFRESRHDGFTATRRLPIRLDL
jgi:hypothetical protein